MENQPPEAGYPPSGATSEAAEKPARTPSGYRPKPKPGTNPTRIRETTPETAPPSQQHRTSKNYGDE
ncbi:MAG: hypothetical protein Q6352_013330 [Candidatus Freyrarchaeum guaymaensis]